MEIYVEYAILENLLLDGALLLLALLAARQKICVWRLCLAATVGAVFAIGFPLLPLPPWAALTLKFLVGALLCVIAVKKQNGRGRYVLTMILFYAFSFCLGGGFMAVLEGLDVEYYVMEGGGVATKLPIGGLFAGLTVFFTLSILGIRKLYKRRRAVAHILPCEIVVGEKRVRIDGMVDTGNTACFEGHAVCFVTPDVLYTLFGAEQPKERMTVRTVSGEKSVGLYPVDGVKILQKGREILLKNAYLSPAVHMLGKEYKLLLPEMELR